MTNNSENRDIERNNPLMEPLAVRSDDAARLLGVSRPKVYELVAREDFHGAFKFGGCTLFSVEALREWVRSQCKMGGIE